MSDVYIPKNKVGKFNKQMKYLQKKIQKERAKSGFDFNKIKRMDEEMEINQVKSQQKIEIVIKQIKDEVRKMKEKEITKRNKYIDKIMKIQDRYHNQNSSFTKEEREDCVSKLTFYCGQVNAYNELLQFLERI